VNSVVLNIFLFPYILCKGKETQQNQAKQFQARQIKNLQRKIKNQCQKQKVRKLLRLQHRHWDQGVVWIRN
jgi:hypothetical protein